MYDVERMSKEAEESDRVGIARNRSMAFMQR